MSEVWKNYIKFSGKNQTKCKTCGKFLKYSGGSTSALWRHSETHLNSNNITPSRENLQESISSSSNIENYFNITERCVPVYVYL